MSYRNKIEIQTKFDHDFADTYQGIDALFKEYCKTSSAKDHSTSATVKRPVTTQNSVRNSILRPGSGTRKHSEASISVGNRKSVWEQHTLSTVNQQDIQHNSEYDGYVMQKLGTFSTKNSSTNWGFLDDEVTQLAHEFGISLEVLATIHSHSEKHQYILECMRKRTHAEMLEFNRKHNVRMNQILQFDIQFQKNKERVDRETGDIFEWLNVNSPHEPLKKKLRLKLADVINDQDNQSIIEASLEEIKKSKDDTTLNSPAKKIMFDNLPIVDNLEILQGMIGNQNDNLFKLTKSMKHARRKNESKSISSDATATTTGVKGKMNLTIAPIEEKENESHIDEDNWSPQKEAIFRDYREEAKSRMFDMIKSSDWNKLGFSPLVQMSLKSEKSRLQRDAKLASYMNGNLLTPEEYKLLASTSVTLNKFVDKKYLQTVVNNLDPDVVEALETDLAENIVKDHHNRQKSLKEPRLKYLKERNKSLAERVEFNDQIMQRKAKVREGMYEQSKIKKRTVNLLNKVEERKRWKKPGRQLTKDPIFKKDNVDIGHFASKFLKVVDKAIQARKWKEHQNFLKKLLPYRRESNLIDVQASKHYFHPSSKLIVNTEDPTKDFLGLGTGNPNPRLVKRQNEPVEAYKLHIHSPTHLKKEHNFKRFYSGGPQEDENQVFQGNYIVGDVSSYRIDRFKERVVLRIQAAWRGYKQRRFFRQVQERARENARVVNRLDFLKTNTTSNFLKTVLNATDRAKNRKLKNKTLGPENINKNQLYDSPNKKQTPSARNSKSQLELKAILSSNLDKLKGKTNKPNERQSILIKHYDSVSSIKAMGTLKSLDTLDQIGKSQDSLPTQNDEPLIEQHYLPQKPSTSRPKTALFSKSISYSNNPLKNRNLINPGRRLSDLQEMEGSEQYTPKESRQNKIAARPPPKGLLLKQRKLFTAAKTNNFNVIKTSGFNYFEADVNIKDDQGKSPLFYAAQNGNKEICDFLVRHGANMNDHCTDGNTPLHMAFASGQIMVVILLISSGGNLNILNDYGQTPVAFGSESLLALLDLKDATATYNHPTSNRNLPPEYDNSRFLKKFKPKKDTDQDQLTFNFAPLNNPLGKVKSEKKV